MCLTVINVSFFSKIFYFTNVFIKLFRVSLKKKNTVSLSDTFNCYSQSKQEQNKV